MKKEEEDKKKKKNDASAWVPSPYESSCSIAYVNICICISIYFLCVLSLTVGTLVVLPVLR